MVTTRKEHRGGCSQRGERVRWREWKSSYYKTNDPTMSDSAQLKHHSEVCLTIMASDHEAQIANTDIVPDSDINPYNLDSSNCESNHEMNGETSAVPVPLTPLYYSPPLTKHKTEKSSSGSSGHSPFRSFSNNDETVWYAEDWGGTYSGDLMAAAFKVQNNQGDSACPYPRPEKQLIDFGLRLVILDKTLSGVRMLAFIWATVVLLGGFASMLKKIDFWFVATIIFIVGTGIFSRNHQLESRFFFQAAKVISGKIGMIITFLQLLFAGVSIAFSMMRLVKQGYNGNNEQANMQASLNIFYAVALTHALLFLSEKAYWFWTVSYVKIIEKVCNECGFGTSGKVSVRRFFHETYWKLSKGSVFQALDLDLITFAEGLLLSNSRGDQLISVRILNGLIRHNKFSVDTCRRIRTSTITTNRMVNMLSWHDHGAEAIRTYVAQIVAGVASELQVESIPEAINCISSLLGNEASFELNLLGLVILRNLASNPLNCMKITQRTDLLSKIVQLTKCNAHILDYNEEVRLKMVKRSLKLLKKMVFTQGKAGQIIRQDISQISSIVNNLRDILLYGGTDFVLFKLTVKILAALAMHKPLRKQIASTDGIIRLLVTIFLKSSLRHSETRFWSNAGKSLAVLTVQSKRICNEILRENLDVVQKITAIICTKDVYQSTISVRILSNICAYSGPKWLDNIKQVIMILPWVLNTIMSPGTPEELLEASIGFCVQISKFASIEEFTHILLSKTNFSVIRVAQMLLSVLEENIYPNARCPCLRRHTIELILWIMESDDHLIKYLKESGMDKVLAKTAETTAEFENFHYFSDNFGVMKHPKTISSLVSKARIMVR